MKDGDFDEFLTFGLVTEFFVEADGAGARVQTQTAKSPGGELVFELTHHRTRQPLSLVSRLDRGLTNLRLGSGNWNCDNTGNDPVIGEQAEMQLTVLTTQIGFAQCEAKWRAQYRLAQAQCLAVIR